ncbi:flagellar basal body P-ring protein FlgI [uncultured Microbulbifer sp.]|uniref:flagellar basal body P-ring protein FlgI n=1 Tax=uncultured Microbulbifer sp. TaxID=348147 RepID=UPI00260BC4B8|nr:flagellar basal body P-ring protein FlgI [uncultured Microbulbifer sp.]
MNKFFSVSFLLLVALNVSAISSAQASATPIRELADFAGVRDNQLVGYGLVVGLDGSGDQTMQTPFTTQGLGNMFAQLGITIPPGTNMQLRNVAGVMVTANLPPFTRPGQRLDVVVSSVGNARSLRGGTLLMTPLKGVDGLTYAVAQGNLLVGGAGAESGGSSVQVNQQAGGRIAGGALVEREVQVALGAGGFLDLQLREADFGTAERVVQAINRTFGREVAGAVDAGLVRIISPDNDNDRVRFIARVQQVNVTPLAPPARVVINARSGAVVLNGQVTLEPAAVAHGNLSVVIDTAFGVSQPSPFADGRSVVVPDSNISVREQVGALKFVQGADLMEVVDALNALGATPTDLMTILEALKAAGALRAELEVI